MSPLLLHEFHEARGAIFTSINGFEAVARYRSAEAEYSALSRGVALVDLSFRGRVCLLGADREKFLHGQVTNDILRLKVRQGCYAALLSRKAKMEADLYAYKLAEEILLDFEPGLTDKIIERLNEYIIADDVQVVDVAPLYGLLSVTGPEARSFLIQTSLGAAVPDAPLTWNSLSKEGSDLYAMSNSRYGVPGFDLFVPASLMPTIAEELDGHRARFKAEWAGFEALEVLRIENATPRFGADMTESTIPQEAELQGKAISFSKGCYIGQEIIARIRTYGQVAKALRLIRVAGGELPPAGAQISVEGKNIGTVTSSTFSPRANAILALGYVRKEHFTVGSKLQIGDAEAEIISVPGA